MSIKMDRKEQASIQRINNECMLNSDLCSIYVFKKEEKEEEEEEEEY